MKNRSCPLEGQIILCASAFSCRTVTEVFVVRPYRAFACVNVSSESWTRVIDHCRKYRACSVQLCLKTMDRTTRHQHLVDHMSRTNHVNVCANTRHTICRMLPTVMTEGRRQRPKGEEHGTTTPKEKGTTAPPKRRKKGSMD